MTDPTTPLPNKQREKALDLHCQLHPFVSKNEEINILEQALTQSYKAGMMRSAEIATHCNGHGTACSHGQEIAEAITKEAEGI